MKKMRLKINCVPGYAGEVTIQTDENGIPLERFWRKRLKDAETDKCVEVIAARTKSAKREKAE